VPPRSGPSNVRFRLGCRGVVPKTNTGEHGPP
jgi:hypothetical protein